MGALADAPLLGHRCDNPHASGSHRVSSWCPRCCGTGATGGSVATRPTVFWQTRAARVAARELRDMTAADPELVAADGAADVAVDMERSNDQNLWMALGGVT